MIELAGRVVTRDRSPYIYFIRRAGYLYIGETQRSPVSRWCEHIAQEGSFLRALRRIDEDISAADLETEFYGYRCTKIESELQPVETKRATQRVEHELHCRVICDGFLARASLTLISDTVRTAPTGCAYPWLPALVDEIYSEFKRSFNR